MDLCRLYIQECKEIGKIVEFKKVQNINNNMFPEKEQKNLCAEKVETTPEQKSNGKTPINPEYWQQSLGIKPNSGSLGFNPDEKFLISLTPEQMKELYNWIESGKIEKEKILQFLQRE